MTLEEYEKVKQLSHVEALIFLSQVLSNNDNLTYRKNVNDYYLRDYKVLLEYIPTQSNGELSTLIEIDLSSVLPYCKIELQVKGRSKPIMYLKCIRDEIQKSIIVEE